VSLLMDLKERFKLTYLFIAHDLRLVEHICSRVAVMYLGKIVETAPKPTLFSQPLHPYTRALLSAVPRMLVGGGHSRPLIQGDPPSPLNPPPGCRFHTRCPWAQERCVTEEPVARMLGPDHLVACHFAETLPPP
jgi:oligopeptide/dipeptide ABC transporter ATP-binding protein